MEKYAYVRWPGDGKQERFGSRCCPWVLPEGGDAILTRLLLVALASEVEIHLSEFLWLAC